MGNGRRTWAHDMSPATLSATFDLVVGSAMEEVWMAHDAAEPVPRAVRRGRSLAVATSICLLVVLGAAVWPGPAWYRQDRISRADMYVRSGAEFGVGDASFTRIGTTRGGAVVATVIATWTSPFRPGDRCPVRAVVVAPPGQWKVLDILPVPGQRVAEQTASSVTLEARPGSERVVHLSFAVDGTDLTSVQAAQNGGGEVRLYRSCADGPGKVASSTYQVYSDLQSP